MLYIENPKDSTKKLLELIREFGTVTGYNPTRASLVAHLVKNLPAMRETRVSSLGWEGPPGEQKGNPLQYSGLENSMDCIVHGVTKSRMQLSDFTFTFTFHRI